MIAETNHIWSCRVVSQVSSEMNKQNDDGSFNDHIWKKNLRTFNEGSTQ